MTDDLDDTLEHPYINEDPEVISMLQEAEKHYIGDKPIVEHHKDYSAMTRGANYPFDEDIDYDPRIDEPREDWDEDNMQFGLEL